MPVLKGRREAYAQGLANGMTQLAAWAAAGYAMSSGEPSKVANAPSVKRRVLELREQKAKAVMKTEEIRVNTLVLKAMTLIEKAMAKNDFRSAVRMLEVLFQVYGYKDSPTLFHQHMFGTPLTADERDEVKESRAAAAMGASMTEAIKELGRIAAMKTIDPT